MKKKKVQCGLVVCLISAAMLLDVAGGPPKVSDANRETVRIMKNIKIPPPYTPVYQPPARNLYVPSARVMPDYSPKVMPVQPLVIPKSTTTVDSARPVTTTNATVTNIPAVDKAVKTPAPAVTPAKAP